MGTGHLAVPLQVQRIGLKPYDSENAKISSRLADLNALPLLCRLHSRKCPQLLLQVLKRCMDFSDTIPYFSPPIL